MKSRITLIIVCLCALFIACGNKEGNKKLPAHASSYTVMTGDSTIYGLACEGCSDSVVVLLPEDGSDPVTYNILQAHRKGRVLGRLKIGDKIGIVLNKENHKVADLVVDIDQLQGIWCYIVMPRMRNADQMSSSAQAKMIASMSDSLKETFFIPREYGFWLKREWEASSIGYVTEASSLADESPVVYPPLGYFVGWRIWNGKFVMVSGTPNWSKDGVLSVSNLKNDTCNIDYLGDDSLVLSDRDGSRSYYKKKDINDVNKKARAIAAMRSKKALEEATENK